MIETIYLIEFMKSSYGLFQSLLGDLFIETIKIISTAIAAIADNCKPTAKVC